MLVLKFGGSSVGNIESLNKVKNIVESKSKDCVVVVSAMSGITDDLCRMFEIAFKKGEGYMDLVRDVESRHIEIAEAMVPPGRQLECIGNIKKMVDHLENILNCIAVLKESSDRSRDFVLSFGELLSSQIVVSVLDNAQFVDARDLIVTDDNFGSAKVLWEESKQKINASFEGSEGVKVVNGFSGKTKEGYSSTLGRGGSDLSASLIAAALNVEELEIWTDVNGMMTADPRLVSDALTIPLMKYNEAAELSHFGAKVLYTPSLWPVINKGIPVLIKNTLEPKHVGSLINAEGNLNNAEIVKGISSISDMSLITMCGNGLMGDIGFAHKLFAVLSENDINIVLISQASSEYSISFAVRQLDADRAVCLLEEKFAKEFNEGVYSDLVRQDNMAIVAVVGDNMRNIPGVSGKVFSVLGKNSVNINAIAQGASEANISFVVTKDDEQKAIRLLHDKFFLGGAVKLDIYLAGLGTVGGELIKQIVRQKEYLRDQYKMDMSIKGLLNSRKMLVGDDCLSVRYDADWMKNAMDSNLKEFVDRIKNGGANNKIFVDCTGGKDVADLYLDLLGDGVSVVTANKIAASSEYANYRNLLDVAKRNGCCFRFETNVGAGLPILQTIEDMVKSGDRINSIDAVLSGSLNYIFNKLSEGMGIFDAIKSAEEKGFTEPDPRIDLSGLDVKRKLLIMSRVAGFELEGEHVTENMFLPDNVFQKEDMEDFWNEISVAEKSFDAKYGDVFRRGNKLRYVASFNEGKASLGLMEVDNKHPFFDLEDSNNIVMIRSERYKDHPLTIRGYGAGAEVTAAGVFADIMKSVVEN